MRARSMFSWLIAIALSLASPLAAQGTRDSIVCRACVPVPTPPKVDSTQVPMSVQVWQYTITLGLPTYRDSTIPVVVPLPPTGYPHQPVGYVAMVHYTGASLPPYGDDPLPLAAPDLGSGYRYPSANANLTTATVDGRSVLQGRFPKGLAAGIGPVNAGFWNGKYTEKSKIYLSVWLKILGTTFETHPCCFKPFGFVGYGRDPTLTQNEGYWAAQGNNKDKPLVPMAAFVVWFAQQNNVDRHLDPNRNTGALLTVGIWHQFEAVMELNTLGKANGIFRFWIDGQQTHEFTDMVYLNTTTDSKGLVTQNTHGFTLWKWNPTWGGYDGPIKTRDDFIVLDDVYLSGQ